MLAGVKKIEVMLHFCALWRMPRGQNDVISGGLLGSNIIGEGVSVSMTNGRIFLFLN